MEESGGAAAVAVKITAAIELKGFRQKAGECRGLACRSPSSARADLYLRVRGQLDGHINLTRASAGFEQVLNGAPHLLDERVEALGLDIKPGRLLSATYQTRASASRAALPVISMLDI